MSAGKMLHTQCSKWKLLRNRTQVTNIGAFGGQCNTITALNVTMIPMHLTNWNGILSISCTVHTGKFVRTQTYKN